MSRPKCKRMWINRPSSQQHLFKQHGVNVLMQPTPEKHSQCCTIYFLEGSIISMVVPTHYLSEGWNKY